MQRLMSKINEIIGSLKDQWATPREVIHRGQKCPFLLACSFALQPAEAAVLERLPVRVPDDVREFWLVSRSASLFKDEKYGQWGVEVLDPMQALAETKRQATSRPHDFQATDLVLARFFGDLDLVVLACDSQHKDYGSVKIALPIDKRPDW